MGEDADLRISREDVDVLAQIAALSISSGDVEGLIAALTLQVSALRRLDQLDLMDIEPAITFDPRWRD